MKDIGELITRMAKASLAIGTIEFDARNGAQSYRYASAASVIAKVREALAAEGVIVSAETSVDRIDIVEVETRGGKQSRMVVFSTTVATFRYGDASIKSSGIGSAMDTGDKASMKACTAGYKYALAHGLMLGWGALDPEVDSPEAAKSATSFTKFKL